MLNDCVGDGKVICLFSFSKIDQNDVEKHLHELGDSRIVVVCPTKILSVKKQLRDYEIIQELRKDQAFTSSNEILNNEIPLLIEDLTLTLEKEIQSIYEDDIDTKVFFCTEGKIKQELADHEEQVINKCCEKIYTKTPIINNEMVNREVIGTPQTKKARLNIIQAILNHTDDEVFYGGTNQEASIYRASQKYIDAFLNTLSLYTYNQEYRKDEYKVELIKKNKILDISPENIHKNTEKICMSLDRALFFFQTRCGIRSINELNYSLMLSLVATVFTNDAWFYEESVHRKLEAWYWSSVFSGRYDRDQNIVFIQDMQSVIDMLKESGSVEWIERNVDYIMEAQNFSDKQLILMEKTSEERFPKRILRNFMCQFLLSKTYTDMFEKNQIVSVFSDISDPLEAHHIIPLGSVKKVGESTSELRKNEKNICNSPLNFVYITKSANEMISAKPLESYVALITDEAKSALHIQKYNTCNISDEDIKQILSERYTALKGEIRDKVKRLLR